jgi:DNA-binding CsgD family transcriptional regulator
MVLLLSRQLLAQESLPIQNFSSSDYRAQQQNWAIDQSPEGLIYVGNSDGLLEYDGAEWQLYPFPNGQPVRAVLCAGNKVYVGGYGEFGYWEKDTENTLHYHSLSDTSRITSIQSEEIWRILANEEGTLFQSFSRIYLHSDPENGTAPLLSELSGPKNFMLASVVHQRTILQLIGDELYELEKGSLKRYWGATGLSRHSVSALLPFGKQDLMIVTSKSGILISSLGLTKAWESELEAYIQKDIINTAIRLRNGNYAIGTQLSGVYIVSSEGKLIAHFSQQNGLQNNSVLNLFQDEQQNVWVALDKGIDLIPLTSPVSHYRSESTPLEATYSVALWQEKLYVGTNQGVFWKPWPSSQPFKMVPGLEGHVWELKNYDDQLICGHNDGTFLITDSGVQRLSEIRGGWTSIRFRTEQEDFLLQGTYTGLSAYKKNTKGKWIFSHIVANVPPIPIKHLAIGPQRTVWMAHAQKGLFQGQLTKAATALTEWQQVTKPDLLRNAYNVDVTQWRGAPLIKSGNHFFSPSVDQRLLEQSPPETAGETLLKLREGIAGDYLEIYPNHVTIRNALGSTANLPISLIRTHETITAIDNRYYFFCTHNGYYVYDRTLPTVADDRIGPVLRRITNRYNQTIRTATNEKITIPAKSGPIRLHFFMPVYGESVRFRYRLDKVAPEGSDWMDQRLIELPELIPGSYTLILENSYNKATLPLQIEVLPQWHESALARLGLICLALLVMIALYSIQEKRMRNQRTKLTKEHEEKLLQKELASQKRIIEIQNEKMASEINLKSQQLSNIAINVIRKNEILESIKEELIEVKTALGQQLPHAHYQRLLDSINRNLSGKDDWTLFEDNFNDVHEAFFQRLKRRHADLTPGDLRLAAALRMNLSSKEIAPILGISVRGVEIKRYRLRKKLGLAEETNLINYMMDV